MVFQKGYNLKIGEEHKPTDMYDRLKDKVVFMWVFFLHLLFSNSKSAQLNINSTGASAGIGEATARWANEKLAFVIDALKDIIIY